MSASTPGVLHSSEWRVTTAAEAAARDRAAIAAGTPSFQLMLAAGTAAASLILRDYGSQLTSGAAVFVGGGNNGGDGYVVAAQLARAGVSVRVLASGEPKTADARRAAALLFEVSGIKTVPLSQEEVEQHAFAREQLVIDALLGTGQSGPLRDDVKAACRALMMRKGRGATIVALDIPTGLDATTGAVAEGAIAADCTVCFGTVKRGVLFERGLSGRVVLVDIGLGRYASHPTEDAEAGDSAWVWFGSRQLGKLLPTIAWNAHKGLRGRVLVAGGDMGMAGAVIHAANSALLSGAGVLHILAETQSVSAIQSACPSALAHRWPALEGMMQAPGSKAQQESASQARFAATPVGVMREDVVVDAVAIGPGLGRSRRSGRLLQHVMRTYRNQPLVIDADALWHAGDIAQALGTDPAALLSHWTREAPRGADGSAAVVCTPHLGEFSRLLGAPASQDWSERVAQLQDFVERSGVTVLLKGTPTLVASPGRKPLTVVPHGTALLATGGSGDCLTGIIATLLAQGVAAHDASVLAATVHGYAAELATEAAGGVRGTSIAVLLGFLPSAWRLLERASYNGTAAAPYVIAELRNLS